MNKYHNKKTVLDGIKFDSTKEANRYAELTLMSKAGAISRLELQPRFELLPAFELRGKKYRKCEYVADFGYFEDGVYIIEDVKSAFTKKNPLYQLKKKMLLRLLSTVDGIQEVLSKQPLRLATTYVRFVEYD